MNFKTDLVANENKVVLKNGKDDLMDYLYNKFSPVILGFILKNIDSRKEAEDLLAEVFLKLNSEINDLKYDEKCRLIDIIRIAARIISKQKDAAMTLESNLI
jgi:hypothetical protein